MICAIYCRLSKEDDSPAQESQSIQNQKNMLVSYAVKQNWDIYKIYSDDDYSGADRERPEFINMLNDAKTRKFSVVLCKTQSRFTRDIEIVEKYIHGLFPIWGVRFVALLDNVDTDVAGNKKARQINSLINEWYLEDLSNNVKAVFEQKRKSGQYIGSFAAYGYKKDPLDRNRLIIDPAAAGIVNFIFAEFLSGKGTNKIASCLNGRGVASPANYKNLNSGSIWYGTTVSRILKNENYLGTLVQGKTLKPSYKSKKIISLPESDWVKVENTHAPIISPEIFHAAQLRLKNNTRSDGKGKTFPLSKKIFCARCGANFSKTSYVYKENRREYLQCKTYAKSRGNPLCTPHSIRLDKLTGYIDGKIKQYIRQFYVYRRLTIQTLDTAKDSKIKACEREIAAIKKQIDKYAATMLDLYKDKTRGLLSPAQFVLLSENLTLSHKQSARKLAGLQKYLASLKNNEMQTDRKEKVEAILAREEIEPLLYDLFVDKISICEDELDTKTKITVYWKI